MTGRHSAHAAPSGPERAGRGRTALAIGGAGVASAAVVVVVLALLGLGTGPTTPLSAGAGAHLGGGGSPAVSSPAAPSRAASSPAVTRRPATASAHADPFGAAAASYVATRSGTVLAAVYDVRTGQTWTLGHGQPQAEASVVKLDVLEALLRQHGGGLSAAEQALARQMIEDSDNDAATTLWDSVGGASGIRSYNTAAGLAHTTPSLCVECPGFPWPGWGLTTTLPTDQIALLRRLVEPGSLLTSGARSYALSLMENVTPDQRWGVSGGVPATATVALKNGWLPLDSAGTDWQINSVGSISGSGRDYLMAVLSTRNPDEQYGIDTISRLSAIVWAGLG